MCGKLCLLLGCRPDVERRLATGHKLLPAHRGRMGVMWIPVDYVTVLCVLSQHQTDSRPAIHFTLRHQTGTEDTFCTDLQTKKQRNKMIFQKNKKT